MPRQKPVLTINSGDIVKLETATGTPGYFEKLGVPKDKIPAELYVAFEGVNDGARRDHQLTGPIYVTGAALGDMLEIRLRSIELRLPIAGQSFGTAGGGLPGEFPSPRDRVLWLDLKNKTAEYAPGVVVPLKKPFFGSISVVPPPSIGRVTDQRPNFYGGNMDNADLSRRNHALPAGVRSGCAALDRRRPRGAGRWRGRRFGDRDVAQGRDPGHPAQGQDHQAAPRGNAHRVHDDGVSRRSRRGREDRDARDAGLARRR